MATARETALALFGIALEVIGIGTAIVYPHERLVGWGLIAVGGVLLGYISIQWLRAFLRNYRFVAPIQKRQQHATNPSPPASVPENPVGQAQAEKIFVRLTPQKAHEIFKKHDTSWRAEAELATYIDKWVEMKGAIDDVARSFTGRMYVSFVRDGGFGPWVFADFPEHLNERVKILENGEQITVIGRISHIDYMGIQLKDCDLRP